MATKKILTDLEILGTIQVDETSVENNTSVGIDIDINKENTSGAGFASNVYGIKSYAKANSTEIVLNIGGTWSKAEHLGSGTTYYITGGTNRGYHSGSGNSSSISGTFSEARVTGTGTGDHDFVIGVNSIAKLDNANANVNFLQGQHNTIKISDGEVTDIATCLILDLDHTGGTISGDFEYLKIQNDSFHSAVGGTARAIYSASTLPSEFGGSIQSPTFYLGSVSSYIRNNAGDTEIYAEAGLAIESADGMIIEMSDVIDISGGGTLTSDGSIEASSFIKTGGTSSQFLKADGSVDSSTYLTSADVTSSQWDAATGGINYSSGNVGIGTDSPNKLLHLVTTTTDETQQLLIQNGNSGDAAIMFNISGDTYSLGIDNSDSDKFKLSYGNLGTNDRIVIDSTGNVGIGTASPQAKLDVDGGIRMADDTATASADNEGTMRYYTDANGSYMDICMQYQNSGTPANDYKWTNVVRHIFPS